MRQRRRFVSFVVRFRVVQASARATEAARAAEAAKAAEAGKREGERLASEHAMRGCILQMKTGEGKSIVIAMLAVFMVKLYGKRVNCLLYTSPSPRDS